MHAVRIYILASTILRTAITSEIAIRHFFATYLIIIRDPNNLWSSSLTLIILIIWDLWEIYIYFKSRIICKNYLASLARNVQQDSCNCKICQCKIHINDVRDTCKICVHDMQDPCKIFIQSSAKYMHVICKIRARSVYNPVQDPCTWCGILVRA